MMAGKDAKLGKAESDNLREDLMKVQRIHSHASDMSIDTSQRDNDRHSGDGLPQLVRDYILHDRGNSLYLGDSFANLPSPVAENATIKRLFKFKEDEDEMNKPRHAKNESQNNKAIRIEGKKQKKKEDNEEEENDLDVHKIPKVDFNLNIEEIDNIVFSDTIVKPKKKEDAYSNVVAKASAPINRSTSNAYYAYEEEESYENPVNLSKMPGG